MRDLHDIQSILERVLKLTEAPHAQVLYSFRNLTASRFGNNAITQNKSGDEEEIQLSVAYGKHHGTSSVNQLSDDVIGRLVQRAEEIAKASPEDPEHMPPLKEQTYQDVPERFSDEVVHASPEQIARNIDIIASAAHAEGYEASGIHQSGYETSVFMNSEGLIAADRHTWVSISTTIHGPNGSGSASTNTISFNEMDIESIARSALETARVSQDPEEIEPGDYTVIFEPKAVADYLQFLRWNMEAREAEEGATVFANQLGETVVHPMISVTSEVADPHLWVPKFGEDGVAAENITWIRNGVLERLHYDRYWADQKKVTPDSFTFPPICIEGTKKPLSELISECSRGLLVKHLWYIRYVDRRELLLTGMTRDGLFLIEDGKIVKPVMNLRFNESPIVFLKNVVDMSESMYVDGWAKVPGIMSNEFTFSSKSESL